MVKIDSAREQNFTDKRSDHHLYKFTGLDQIIKRIKGVFLWDDPNQDQ